MRIKARILYWIGLLCFVLFFLPNIQHNRISNGTEDNTEDKLTLGWPGSPWLVGSWTETKTETKSDSKDPKGLSSSSSSHSSHSFNVEFIAWSWLFVVFGVTAMMVIRRMKAQATTKV